MKRRGHRTVASTQGGGGGGGGVRTAHHTTAAYNMEHIQHRGGEATSTGTAAGAIKHVTCMGLQRGGDVVSAMPCSVRSLTSHFSLFSSMYEYCRPFRS